MLIWGVGGGLGARLPMAPNFEAQIFATAATPLRNVGKMSLGPPYTNRGSAPASLLGSWYNFEKKTHAYAHIHTHSHRYTLVYYHDR